MNASCPMPETTGPGRSKFSFTRICLSIFMGDQDLLEHRAMGKLPGRLCTQ